MTARFLWWTSGASWGGAQKPSTGMCVSPHSCVWIICHGFLCAPRLVWFCCIPCLMWCLVSSFGDMWSRCGSQTGVELLVWLTLAVGVSWACLQQMMCLWNSDRVFNVWPVVASLFLQLCWWIQRDWMKHETTHEWENWQNISGCWCMPLIRPRPLSQSVPLPISNVYWKTSMLAHQSRSNSFSKNWKRIGRSLTKRRNGSGRRAWAETSQVQVTCVKQF